jgi:hypothetical protein
MTTHSQVRRAQNERGSALIIALLATMLLTALGLTLVMMSNTETAISANYRNSQETLYAADAAVERVVQDLLLIPRWNDVLAGDASVSPSCTGVTSFLPKSSTPSAFVDGSTTVSLPNSSQQINLLSATCNMQKATNTLDLWGPDDPVWRLFAWGPIDNILPGEEIDSSAYVAVWIADDPADADGNPSMDTNGTLTLHAEAYGPGGARKVIEVTVARTASTEIERGQISQRGQDELNQRARKAAVQTPGKSLSNLKMNVTTGTLQ